MRVAENANAGWALLLSRVEVLLLEVRGQESASITFNIENQSRSWNSSIIAKQQLLPTLKKSDDSLMFNDTVSVISVPSLP